jgi:hypothetical protein
METNCYYETSVDFQRTTRRYTKKRLSAAVKHQILTTCFDSMGSLHLTTTTDEIPVINAYPQFLKDNSKRMPTLGRDQVLPNSIIIIHHSFIWQPNILQLAYATV